MKYPIALPWSASSRPRHRLRRDAGLAGQPYFVAADGKKPNLHPGADGKALEEMKSLLPYMDPQVTTFDQPKVQQQLYNG